jgi:hypothetical protein
MHQEITNKREIERLDERETEKEKRKDNERETLRKDMIRRERGREMKLPR